MSKFKVLVADKITNKGVDFLNAQDEIDCEANFEISADELQKKIAEYHGIIVRSRTKLPAELLKKATKLKVVGRAGVGVDNIDVNQASAQGIVVLNTPGGNTTSTAEHAFALMLAAARKIPFAHKTLGEGGWGRSNYTGVELFNKRLTVLGCGKIGSEFIKRARAFGLKITVYDPYISQAKAERLGVKLAKNVEEAITDANFLSLHLPLNDDTRNVIDAKRLQLLGDKAVLVNCARGGLVDEQALLEAVKSKKLFAAALDVYGVEPPPADSPLRSCGNLVLSPHLGASTAEAQENVGIEIAKSIYDFLVKDVITNSVNMPNIDQESAKEISPYLRFTEILGKIAGQLAPAQSDCFRVSCGGKISNLETSLIARAALSGYLSHVKTKGTVNYINSMAAAKEMGLRVSVAHIAEAQEFADIIEVSAFQEKSSGNCGSVTGTYFGKKPRIVKLNDNHVEARPEGCLLLLENNDVPGIVGKVGKLLGDHNTNIANMSLNRNRVSGKALSALNLDSQPPKEAIDELTKMPEIISARVLSF